MEYIEVSAKTKDEAIIKASMQLETPSDQLDIQVVSEGSSGFLGIGSKPAIIRVRKKEVEEPEVVEIVKEVPKEEIEEVKEVFEEKKPKAVKKAPEARPKKKKEYHKREQKEAVQPKEIKVKPSKAIEPITDPAEIEEVQNRAKTFLEGVFKAMKLDVEIKTSYDSEEGCLEAEFNGDDMGILIGKRGQTLDSLQYLTSIVVNKEKVNYIRVKLDTENYRNRRKETLENLAKGIAYKVRKTRKAVVLEPMNPYERRIIHSTLQNNKYVETTSEEEPYRHVVVKLKK